MRRETIYYNNSDHQTRRNSITRVCPSVIVLGVFGLGLAQIVSLTSLLVCHSIV